MGFSRKTVKRADAEAIFVSFPYYQPYHLVLSTTPTASDYIFPLPANMPTLNSFRDIAEVIRTQPDVQFQVSLLGSGLIDTQAEIPAVGIQSTIARTDTSRANSKIWKRSRESRASVSDLNSAASYAETARQNLTRDLLPLLQDRIKDAYWDSDQTLVDIEDLEPLFQNVVADYSKQHKRYRKEWYSLRKQPSQISYHRRQTYSRANPSSPHSQSGSHLSSWAGPKDDQSRRCSEGNCPSGGRHDWAVNVVDDEAPSSSSYSSNSIDL